jgi:hypothetical protein
MAVSTPSRTTPLGVRVTPELRDALARAAADDDRSIASFVEHALRQALVERGYLPATGPKPLRKKGKASE